MTVAELQKKLDGLDPTTFVVVNHEIDCEMNLLEITDIALVTGYPRRHEDTRKAGFKFDNEGPVKRLFISVEEA
ncbi:MAG TPA: hypothetical protein VK638_40730 [Edaphobacter sp.]|nr:hypothetical protein [Edaphobacter sp.]